MTASIVPKSDQLNADDLITSEVTVTIEKVSAGSSEQPVDVHLVEFPGRAFRPSKSMRRVMVAAWGAEASAYTGRKMTLYRDPKIRFGKDEVGGIRISHMSHINGTLKIALTVSRGKREAFIVEPLGSAPQTPSAPARANATDEVAPTGDGATPAQIGLIGSLMKKLGMTEKETSLAYVEDVIKRKIESSAELTKSEASAVITSLKTDDERQLPDVPVPPASTWENVTPDEAGSNDK